MGWFSDIVDAIRGRLAGGRPEPVAPGQLASVDAVIARLADVGATLPEGDGVRSFHVVYQRVTELVRERIAAGDFTDRAFIDRLDCVFAGLYLDAVASPDPDPAWAPVFESRHTPGILSIQFAVAGVNAHINHDLSIALVRACRQLGLTLDSAGVQADYQRMTEVLDTVQEQVRQSFFDGLDLELDRYAAPLANLIGSFSIARARDAAWTNAQVLWRLDGTEPLRTDYVTTLGRTVGMAGRVLLTPVALLAHP
ncbi:DUF5995 family protein [Monashia sp. NPDC004114]